MSDCAVAVLGLLLMLMIPLFLAWGGRGLVDRIARWCEKP